MQPQQQPDAQPVRRKRGRPAGARDSVKRVRRKRGEVAAEPKKVKPVRESDIQAQFMKWMDMQPAPGVPGGKLGHFAYAPPNGLWIPGTVQQRIQTIMAQRRVGMKKGIPDVIIDLPMGHWHGARLELKRFEVADSTKGGTASVMHDEQIEWLERLRSQGYFVEVCIGLEGACDAVRRYLDGEPPLPFPWEVQE
jgi:hypothetical protein